MGWDYTRDATKSDIVDSITGDVLCDAQNEVICRTIKKSVQGNVLWTVQESRQDGSAWGENDHRWIGCYLLAKLKGFGYGYKSLEESMGPCEVSCPLAFLSLVGEPVSEYSVGWRDRVREFHAKRAILNALKPGDKITFASQFNFGRLGRFNSFEVKNIKTKRFVVTAGDGTRTTVRLRATDLSGYSFDVAPCGQEK